MKFVNNTEEAVKVKTEGNEKLPPVFRTVKPGDSINANSKEYCKGYADDGLTAVKGPVGQVLDKVMGKEEEKAEEPLKIEPEKKEEKAEEVPKAELKKPKNKKK